MPNDIVDLIRDRFETLTRSEKVIASYILGNPDALLLESAGGIARSAGVSSMTATRFFRKLGFEDNVDLKNAIRSGAGHPNRRAMWSIRDRYDAATGSGGQGREDSLELEIASTRRAYELAATPLWKEAVETISNAPRVYVHGLQITRGLAAEFAYRLEYVRPRVVLSDGHNGTFSEILTDEPSECCVVLIDIHRYARASRELAELMTEARIPFFVVTDDYCHWARDLTDRVFALPTATELFWHSTAPMSVLLNLLVNDVVGYLGPRAKEHIDRVMNNQFRFGQFLEAAR